MTRESNSDELLLAGVIAFDLGDSLRGGVGVGLTLRDSLCSRIGVSFALGNGLGSGVGVGFALRDGLRGGVGVSFIAGGIALSKSEDGQNHGDDDADQQNADEGLQTLASCLWSSFLLLTNIDRD